MITIKSVRSYKPKGGNGKVTFVYHVFGSPAELAEYERVQGKWYRTDTIAGKVIPVWFTPRFVGETCDLILTQGAEPRFVADTSEYDKANSIVSQYGGNLGTAIADKLADKLMAKSNGQSNNTAPKTVQNVPDPEGLATDPLDGK